MSWLYYVWQLLTNLPKIADIIKEILDLISKIPKPEVQAQSAQQLSSLVGALKDTKLHPATVRKAVAMRDGLKAKL